MIFPLRRSRKSGFTLIEVVIAIGIFSFAITSLIGLIPIALKSSRDSLDLANATQLATTLQNEVARSDFSTTNPVSPRWFDSSLHEVPVPAGSLSSIYKAEVVLADSVSPNLRRLRVTIERGGDEQTFCFVLFNKKLP